jgi:hypothetical protein
MLMMMWLIVRAVGLLVAAVLALWAFASFACIWQGTYSYSTKGKAGFSRSPAYCAIQGAITFIGAVLLVYLSVRHY